MIQAKQKADELRALAERCEQARDCSRQIDAEVFCAVNGFTFRSWNSHAHPAAVGYTGAHEWFYTRPSAAVPIYTASLDAAMTLVPGGLFHILWGHRSRSDDRPAATVGDSIGKHESSLPCALVAAALYARAAILETEQ